MSFVEAEKHIPPNLKNIDWVGPDNPLGLAHNVRIPHHADFDSPVPVVVLVHGWAGNEAVMWLFARAVPEDVLVITPRAPVKLAEGKYVWFRYRDRRLHPNPDSLREGVDALTTFLQKIPDVYPVDSRRIVLVGFSQGAMMINSFVMARPKCTIGVASMGGFLSDTIKPNPNEYHLDGLPVFIAHGNRDDVVPIDLAHQTRTAYTKLGAEVTYHEYDIGHKMPVSGIKTLAEWMEDVILSDREADCS